MKDLTIKELDKAPHKVQFLYCMAIMKRPVGSKMVEEAISEHPEYFPEEVEHRRKWSLVPESVNKAYFEEFHELRKEVYKDVPSGGISFFLGADPTEVNKWHEANEKARKAGAPLFEALHNKYFGEYGIKWNGGLF